MLYTNLTLKTGVSKLYNVFTGGLVPADTIQTWSFGYGFGHEGRIGKKILHSYDLTANWINEKGKPFGTFNMLMNLRINFAYLLGKRASFFLGPSINFHLSEWIDVDTGEFLSNIAPYSLNTSVFGETQMQIWIGGQAGFRF